MSRQCKRVFEEVSDQQLQELMSVAGSSSHSTQRTNEIVVRMLDTWARDRGTSVKQLQGMDKSELATQLSSFMAGYRLVDGSKPKLNTLKSAWHALVRVVQAWPANINMKNDDAFEHLRRTIAALSKEAIAEGRGQVVSCPLITASDTEKIKIFFDSPRTLEDPERLQLKVFYDIQSFRRGGSARIRGSDEDLRAMTTSTFEVSRFDDGKRVVVQTQSPSVKNQDYDNDTIGFMPEIDHEYLCPVKTFELYLSKLDPSCKLLWPQPMNSYRVSQNTPVWYTPRPIGKNNLRVWMGRISELAGCSISYTNNSLRKTGKEVSDHCGTSSWEAHSNSLDSCRRIGDELARALYGQAPAPGTPNNSEPYEFDHPTTGVSEIKIDPEAEISIEQCSPTIQLEMGCPSGIEIEDSEDGYDGQSSLSASSSSAKKRRISVGPEDGAFLAEPRSGQSISDREKEDEFGMFGKYIAESIRNLPDDSSRRFVMHKINNLMYDVQTRSRPPPSEQTVEFIRSFVMHPEQATTNRCS